MSICVLSHTLKSDLFAFDTLIHPLIGYSVMLMLVGVAFLS